MNDSNCNCCACQYSTPPWWVTMGFIPPYGYQGPSGGGTPTRGTGTPMTPLNPGTPTGTTAQPQQPQQSGGGLGSIIGDVLGPIGGVLGALGL